jgi:hypothetical protein
MAEQSGDERTFIKKGYLIKKGDIVKSWKRRWFMLTHQGEIYYMVRKYKLQASPLPGFNGKTWSLFTVYCSLVCIHQNR